jgi:hypothetical protein
MAAAGPANRSSRSVGSVHKLGVTTSIIFLDDGRGAVWTTVVRWTGAYSEAFCQR